MYWHNHAQRADIPRIMAFNVCSSVFICSGLALRSAPLPRKSMYSNTSRPTRGAYAGNLYQAEKWSVQKAHGAFYSLQRKDFDGNVQ